MNTRLQVEHPVTEEVIDRDLIKEQIKVAAGEPIKGESQLPQLHAIEVRINAEDPSNNYLPSPGPVALLHVPNGFGIRFDSLLDTGYSGSPFYDSLVGKLIVHAENREQAILKMKAALDELVIKGFETNIHFHFRDSN